MTWADAIKNNLFHINTGMLIVQIAALFGLFRYVRDTAGLRQAALDQIKVSQDLLRAANEQAEGGSKPCITIRAKLRDASGTILAMNGAVGGSIADDEDGQYVAVNIGAGPALNVSYFVSVRPNSKQEWNQITTSYFPALSAKQQAQMALCLNAYAGDHELTFLFQSLGGRWYESAVTVQSRVLIDFTFKQLPESFRPTGSYTA